MNQQDLTHSNEMLLPGARRQTRDVGANDHRGIRTQSILRRSIAVLGVVSIIGTALVPGTSEARGAVSRDGHSASSVAPPASGGRSPAPLQKVPGTVTALNEGFEGGFGSFTSFSIGCATTHCLWGSVVAPAHSGTHTAFAADVAEVGDDYLVLVPGLAIPPDATAASLSFFHKYGFESAGSSFYDGGVLEASVDSGNTWTDAGPNITSGGYGGTVASGYQNPLAGRSAWVGDHSAGFTQVQVNLLPYRGPSVMFRMRFGTDNSNNSAVSGWSVDDVAVSYTAPLDSCGRAVSTVSNYPTTIRNEAVVSLGGSIYSFGGRMASNSPTASSYRYDPTSDTWSPIASLPSAVYGATAVTDGTNIYILGGADSGNQPTRVLLRYSPSANTYMTLAPFTTATAFQGAAYVNGVIYRIGGATDPTNGVSTNSVEAYSIASQGWTAAASYPSSLYGLAVMTLNGFIYTAGGASFLGATAKAYRFDPSTNTWDDGQVADLPGPASFAASALYHNRWLVAPASPAPGQVSVAWNPASNTWSSADPVPVATGQTAGTTLNGAFYIIGGSTFSVPSMNTVQKYVETGCTPPSFTGTPPDISVATAPGASSAVVSYPLPAATDDFDVPVVSCAPVSGTTFSVGITKVTCTATDSEGGATTTSFNVNVTAVVDYTPLAPARLADTRPDGTTVDGLFAKGGKVGSGTTLSLTVDGRGGVAGDAAAVALNVTVTEAEGAGYVTVFPCGSPQPTASNLNYAVGDTIPNAVISKVGVNGQVCLFSSQAVHLVVDVNGSFPPASTYHAINPARLLDSRVGFATVDGQQQLGGIVPGGSITAVQVSGRAGVPADASAVALNVTVTGPTAEGFATVYPCEGTPPTASNLNYSAAQTIPNLAISKVGASGAVCVYNQQSTNLVVDVLGYFPAASSFTALLPARVLDTRNGSPTVDGAFQGGGPAAGNTVTTVHVLGRGGVPSNATSAVLNVTVTNPAGPGYATVYPCGIDPPLASNLNYVSGQTIPNAVLTKIGTNGDVCITANQAADLIVDVSGYFP